MASRSATGHAPSATETKALRELLAKQTKVFEGDAKAAVNVSTSAGDGGGLAANVNRWRGQLSQTPWSEADILSMTAERRRQYLQAVER